MAATPSLTLREALAVGPADLKPLEVLELLDVEALRLILLGNSVVDWQQLAFRDRAQVDRFLRLCQFDPDAASDQAWMRAVIRDAVAYLRETFRYRVAEPVANPAEVHDLFLYASGVKEPRYRKIACIVLKVCHVIHHIEGRDLYHRLPLAEEAFGELAEERVMEVCRQMMDAGFPILEASSSAKSRTSLITKLLQKRETLAAQIYDRTRFRVVTRARDEILPVLHCLTQRLFPFNLVVPGQTENSLIDFHQLCDATPAWKPFLAELQFGLDFNRDEKAEKAKKRRPGRNEFSGSTYRVLNFVVDLPLRIDERRVTPEVAKATRARTVFCLVEIQIIDAETASANEVGENSHERYKHRQRRRVLRRLSRGLVVPKKRERPTPV
jgi:uncharacterized protein (TIGR04552 family)